MAIKGSLREASLPDVLQLLSMGKKTGCLAVTHRNNFGYIYFDKGRISYASIVNRRDRIGDLKLAEIDREIAKLAARAASDPNPNLKDDLELLKGDRAKQELAEFRRRAAERPTDFALQFQLGRALVDAGEFDEAIGAFQKSVKDPKTRLDSLLKLGACFQRKGLLDLAEKQLKTALEESTPASERGKSILYNLGLIAEQAGRKSDAFTWFSRIYEADIAYRDVAKKIEALRS